MQKIPLSLAKPGMKLGKAVLRADGMVIVGEGVDLTGGLLSRLEGMNIETIVVEGNPVQVDGASSGASPDGRSARLDHLFRRQGDDWMLKVKAYLRRYFDLRAAAKAAKAKAAEAAAKQGKDDHADA